ncbi:purine-nucleoside phosphorylase [bacterium]|nr:purine-nucleoside phosphorylase [bacterium]
MQQRPHIGDALPGTLQQALSEFLDGSIDGAVVLGSGLGGFSQHLPCLRSIPTTDLPSYPRSTVEGHAGELQLCELGEQRLLLFRGRLHGYEGRGPEEAVLPARIASHFGASKLLVTNAAGGLHPTFRAGDFMLITDLLSLPVTQHMGLELERYLASPLSPGHEIFSPALLGAARRASAATGIELREGTYGFCSGPTYETRSEIGFFRMAGADAVGMSTLPEILAARALGLDVLALSCITNKASTMPQHVSHAEVTEVADRVADSFSRLLHSMLERW